MPRTRIDRVVFFFFLSLISFLAVASCTPKAESKVPEKQPPFKIAIFVPGILEGNPTYEMMVAGVQKASLSAKNKRTVEIKIIEGGVNQSAWQASLLTIAAENYDLIVSSNPSMPELLTEAALAFPERKFLILDADLSGNKQIKTISFDQYQQAFLNGYFAALVSTSALKGANPELVLGLFAGQEYPMMNDQIKTGFLDGARSVDPGFTLDFRVLGNWFDTGKAAEIGRSMYAGKVDVILTIAGAANQGIVLAAKGSGHYVTWFDTSGYSAGSGTVVGSTLVNQIDPCSDAVLQAIDGTLDYGTPTVLGIVDGVIGFDFDNPDLAASVPAEIIGKEKNLIAEVRSGKRTLRPKL